MRSRMKKNPIEKQYLINNIFCLEEIWDYLTNFYCLDKFEPFYLKSTLSLWIEVKIWLHEIFIEPNSYIYSFWLFLRLND